MSQHNYESHWHEEEITLKRTSSNLHESLGIVIEGGTDQPYAYRYFTSIIITRIYDRSLAHKDGRLKPFDIILRINDIKLNDIKRKDAVDALEKPQKEVHLLIRRLSPVNSEVIELEHNGKLGISIAGGFGNPYHEKDHGIFIKGIETYRINSGLAVGDRLMEISSELNTHDLRFVTSEQALKRIQLACSESPKVTLYVGQKGSIHRKRQEQPDCDEIVQVNQTKYIFKGKKDSSTDDRKKRHVSFSSEINDDQMHGRYPKNPSLHASDMNKFRSSTVFPPQQSESHAIRFIKVDGNTYISGVLFVQRSSTGLTANAMKTDFRTYDGVTESNTIKQRCIKEDNSHKRPVLGLGGINTHSIFEMGSASEGQPERRISESTTHNHHRSPQTAIGRFDESAV